MSYYLFQSHILKELKILKPSIRGEFELTDAIKSMIKKYNNVYGLIAEGSRRIDIGDSLSYAESLLWSYKYALRHKKDNGLH